MTKRIPTPQIVGEFAIFKSTGIWVVRHIATNEEIAHEATQRDAITVARGASQ